MQRRKIQRIINAEKIAAGEMIERPANVVKELIENSIDAGAQEIKVIVKKAGKHIIQVIDDGVGIPSEEIEFAFERHTSNKIRSIEDLDHLSTLGFRGEALASITSVSQVEIISRTQTEDLGIELIIEGGKVKGKKEISCPVGTNIKVKNLFYNIPARQKFLKSDSTELGHITDFMQRYSLAFPQIHFIYRHNDLDILNCPGSNDLKTTVFHIFGQKIAKFMEPIEYDEEGEVIKMYGLIGHPQIAKKSRVSSSLYINNRYIISDVLFRAIKEAYKGTLMVSTHPFFVLFIELDPSVVDFNVHPKKLHVRFENEELIYNKVYNIIKSFVDDRFIAKEVKYLSTELEDFIVDEEGASKNIHHIKPQKLEKPIKEIREKKKSLVNEEGQLLDDTVQLPLTDYKGKSEPKKAQGSEAFIREKFIVSDNFPKLHLISYTGQLSNKIYVVLEGINEETNESGLFILDQHAASERINKEKFLNAYQNSKVTKQQLIAPLKLDVSPREKFFLEENIAEVNKLGFSFENFGGNTYILRAIPTIMGKVPNVEIIKEIISDITDIGKDKSFKEVEEDIINYLACHKSIRGGDDLTLKDIRNLLVDLSKCNDPFHCAHGRPTLRFISYRELDKLFKRIV